MKAKPFDANGKKNYDILQQRSGSEAIFVDNLLDVNEDHGQIEEIESDAEDFYQ